MGRRLDPRKKKVTRDVTIRKKERRAPSNKVIHELEDKIETYNRIANTSRVLKHKLYNAQARRAKEAVKKMKIAQAKENGTFVPQKFKTLDDMRTEDATIKAHEDQIVQEELIHAETNDELKAYFTQDRDPKIYVTTSFRATKKTVEFAKDICNIFGGALIYEERYEMKETVRELAYSLIPQGYTSLIVIQERDRLPSHLMLIPLPYGPTCYFRITNVFTHSDLIGAVDPIPDAPPEVIMTNFKTRLGRRVGRVLQQCLSKKELLKARQVVTFHNQRDFIFFRAYRYIFDEKDDGKAAVRMTEIGPEFTLRLRWMQVGIYNPEYEEFEFVQPPHEESQDRKLFFL